MIVGGMAALTSNPMVFLMLVNLLLQITGIIMDEMVVMVTLLSIFLPLINQ